VLDAEEDKTMVVRIAFLTSVMILQIFGLEAQKHDMHEN
jgi:hypothetical protein